MRRDRRPAAGRGRGVRHQPARRYRRLPQRPVRPGHRRLGVRGLPRHRRRGGPAGGGDLRRLQHPADLGQPRRGGRGLRRHPGRDGHPQPGQEASGHRRLHRSQSRPATRSRWAGDSRPRPFGPDRHRHPIHHQPDDAEAGRHGGRCAVRDRIGGRAVGAGPAQRSAPAARGLPAAVAALAGRRRRDRHAAGLARDRGDLLRRRLQPDHGAGLRRSRLRRQLLPLLRRHRSAVRLVPVGARAARLDQHRRRVDADPGHRRRDRRLADPAPPGASPPRPRPRRPGRQPGHGGHRRHRVPGRVAAVQQRPATRTADRLRRAGGLDADRTHHRHRPAGAHRTGDRGGGVQRDAGPTGPGGGSPAAGGCACRHPDHRPASPHRRGAGAAGGADRRAVADLRGGVPGPDPGHRRGIGPHQIRCRPDDLLVPGLPALLLPHRRGERRGLAHPAVRRAGDAAVPVRADRAAAAPGPRHRGGPRAGVATDREHRAGSAAAHLHPHQVGRAVRRVRRPGRRAGRGDRVRVRPRRPAQPPQPRPLPHRAAVRTGLGDLGDQRLVLRRQLRGALVRP